MSLLEIKHQTKSEEEFISTSLMQDFEYEDIFDMLKVSK